MSKQNIPASMDVGADYWVREEQNGSLLGVKTSSASATRSTKSTLDASPPICWMIA